MHHGNCIRSEGDWLCAPPCTHDAEEREAERVKSIVHQNQQLLARLDRANNALARIRASMDLLTSEVHNTIDAIELLQATLDNGK